MKKIYTRSPIFVQSQVGTSLQLGIRIWEGSSSAVPASNTYTLDKAHNSNGNATLEVSELISDYIEHSHSGDYESRPVYVRFYIVETGGSTYNSDTFLALDGYTEGDVVQYYRQLFNTFDDEAILMSTLELATPEDTTTVVPLHGSASAVFFKDGVQKFVYTTTSPTTSTEEIEYATSAGQSASTFYARVILDGGTIIDEHCADEIMEYVTELDVDTVYVVNEDGNAEVIKIHQLPCTKYESSKLVFVNKFGALQDIHFSAKNSKSYSFKGETFKSYNFDYDNLSNNYGEHSTKSFNKNGMVKHTLNTDFLPECYSQTFRELLSSESVWLEHKGSVVPVLVDTKSLEHKTHLNDGLIQFTINVTESHNLVNNIR